MGKLVDLVGSGIGLAREMSKSPQSTPPATTRRSATRDAGNATKTQTKFQSAHQRKLEYSTQTDYQDSLTDDRGDRSVDRLYSNSHEENGARTGGVQWLPQDPVNNWIGSPPPYSADEHEQSINRVLPFTELRSSSRSNTVRGRLARPVIIPQRRPEEKERGFIRAYAPALLDCGIDEATFLNFLDSLNQATKASPVFNAVNTAAFAAGFAPSAAAQVTSIVVSIGVKVAKSKQITRQSNAFLDRINETLFKPNGLLCLIMTYKPDQKSSTVGVNMLAPGVQGKDNTMRMSSDNTNGGLDLPEAAALVFPEEFQSRDGIKGLGSLTADYFDKQSQAKYSNANPDSSLIVGPEPSFNSRFSDPNHAANSGGIIALATGGAVDLKQIRGGRRERRDGRRAERRADRQRDRPSVTGGLRNSIAGSGPEGQRQSLIGGLRNSVVGRGSDGQSQTLVGGARGALKDTMKQGVLYLMIIDNPTEDEVDAVLPRT